MGTRTRTRKDESGKPGYITAEGYRRLEEESHRLWTVDRPKMARAVEVAAAEGDRSENAEYQYSKRKLFEIDRRLSYLGKRLDVLTRVEGPPPDDGRVYFGCWVTLVDEDDVEVTYRVVGADETDAERGYISADSPMARSLLRREVGDEVTVRRPAGDKVYEILAVHVHDPSA